MQRLLSLIANLILTYVGIATVVNLYGIPMAPALTFHEGSDDPARAWLTLGAGFALLTVGALRLFQLMRRR